MAINRTLRWATLALMVASGAAMAQPRITSLGTSGPTSVTNSIGGTYYVGGTGGGQTKRWTLTGSTLSSQLLGGAGPGYLSVENATYQVGVHANTSPTIRGNTATGVAPPFSTTPTLIPSTTQPAVTEFAARRYSHASSLWTGLGGLPITPSLMVYGSGSSGGSTGNFLSGHSISPNGRFIVGQAYISSYSAAAGTTISDNTFQWRPFVWDADANAGAGAITVLPTPFRTSSNTWRRRTGNAYAVSNDGLVIVGAQEHNVATTSSADPDGSRPVVWRWNSGTSSYDMTFLPNGVNGSGFDWIISSTPGMFHMNAAGTIIVGRGVDNAGTAGVRKWTWDSGTSSWTSTFITSALSTQASWLPSSVTTCAIPPTLTPQGMSEDGNTIVGMAVYSTCGSFMSGGFIWTSTDGLTVDWYDHLASLGTPGVSTGGFYGPIGDLGDPSKGLPVLGFPTEISPDGNAVVGLQGGTQVIPGAPPWIVQFTGGPTCVAPAVALDPAAGTNFSACTSSIILNTLGSGTAPLTYQWFKDGSPLVNGTTGSGSVITGATSFQLRVNPPLSPADAGTYYCEISGQCGSPATSANALVQLDPAFPAALNDTCANAQIVGAGTNVLAPAQSPCGAYINDPINGASCTTGGGKTDLWFVHTPATTGDIRIETCGANYDTVVSVFNGCGGGELACNNDLDIGPTAGCTAQRSRIGRLGVFANVPIYIRVAAPSAAFLSTTNALNLSINPAPAAAANDLCGNPSPAVIGANALDTTEATNDLTVTCNATASRDVWFSYTPTAPGKIRAATCPGTTWNTVLSIHNGVCGSELACNDNANVTGCTNQSIINNFAVQAGQTYTFRVGGNSLTAFGAGTLTLGFTCVADVDNGSGTGVPDGGVGIEDLLYYLGVYEAGSIGADVDNGSGTGVPDGGVGIEDLLFYLMRYDTGC